MRSSVRGRFDELPPDLADDEGFQAILRDLEDERQRGELHLDTSMDVSPVTRYAERHPEIAAKLAEFKAMLAIMFVEPQWTYAYRWLVLAATNYRRVGSFERSADLTRMAFWTKLRALRAGAPRRPNLRSLAMRGWLHVLGATSLWATSGLRLLLVLLLSWLGLSALNLLVAGVEPTAFGGVGLGHFGDAAYYTMVSMTTLGYGDITPVSGLARCLAIAQTFSGFFILGSLVATVLDASRL